MTPRRPPKRFLPVIAALAVCLAAACGHFNPVYWSSGAISTLSRGEPSVHISKLDNGLTVIIKESHANPIVTLDVWVNTGSMNEPAEIGGVSHFLEHMMFKGTKTRPVGKVDLDIESVGGETNAATSKDFTHYYVTVASDYVTTGLDVLSDVMMNSTLDPKEMERERQVILEEYRRKQDSPFGFLYDTICDAAFLSSPYKQSVIGTTESLTNLTREQLLDYYRRYYTPDNMVLVVVGDLKTKTILPEIKRYFEPYRRARRPFENLNLQTRRAPGSTKVIGKDVRDTYLIMAFPAPGIDNRRDTIAMDVLLGILGEGRSSRLYRVLREEKKLVSGVNAGYETTKQPSLSLVVATLEAKNLDETKKATLEEIRRVRSRLVGRRELAKVKKMATNAYYFSNETTNGQSDTIGHFYTISGSEEFERNYLKELNRVTAADVRRIAREYLDPDKMVMVTLQPKNSEPKAGGGK
jgi:zinc protease